MTSTFAEDISDDPKYTIKSVCDQTGILPVTLRAWERRHEVLNPQRGDNRYRLYSERDVAILRWIKNRLESGISISSAVADYGSSEKWRTVGSCTGHSFSTPKPVMPPVPPAEIAHKLYLALIEHNEEVPANCCMTRMKCMTCKPIFCKRSFPRW
jgi:hypothetical protein